MIEQSCKPTDCDHWCMQCVKFDREPSAPDVEFKLTYVEGSWDSRCAFSPKVVSRGELKGAA